MKGFKYIKLPGFVKLNQYIDSIALEEIQRLGFILTGKTEDPDVLELRRAYKAKIPTDRHGERIEAIKEFAVIAQRAAQGL